jgi:hypothetical protein
MLRDHLLAGGQDPWVLTFAREGLLQQLAQHRVTGVGRTSARVPYTDMRHSDILGSVALTRGENPFTWRAFIKDERCFDAQHALQSITLRLTNHHNVPLPGNVHFSCTDITRPREPPTATVISRATRFRAARTRSYMKNITREQLVEMYEDAY